MHNSNVITGCQKLKAKQSEELVRVLEFTAPALVVITPAYVAVIAKTPLLAIVGRLCLGDL